MEKYFRWAILRNAVLLIASLSALLALINLPFFDGGTFFIGFPTHFFTLYLDKVSSPNFHLSLSGLALDLVLAYAVCWLIDHRRQSK